MKQVFIISSNFYDVTNNQFTIGGIQTYIKDLCSAINRYGNQACLVQFGSVENDQCIISDECKIRLVKYCQESSSSRDQKTFDKFYRHHNSTDSIFIIDTDQRDIRSNNANVIQIQHGITFDIPGNMIPGIWGKFKLLQRINKQIRCWRNAARLTHVRNTVCVDYNYYNWFRTQDTIPDDVRVKVIPNYAGTFMEIAAIEEKINTINTKIKIVFARRFVDYRGTRLMIGAAKKLLDQFENIEVTFAGGGPLQEEIETAFKGEKRVHITKYESKDSVSFHYNFDVAVVPTIFSEGTSLSLCEAMAAGCIPVASCVGGMSNILLDGYNGLVIQPKETDLVEALTEVITMAHEKRKIIAKRAYDTALESFSKARWEKQWISFLEFELD